MYAYRQDQELPAMAIEWLDSNGDVIDFSTGWTFTAKVATKTIPGTALITKTTGITGAATSPNVVIDWSTTDWSALAPATGGTVHVVHLTARRTSDSKDRVFRPERPIDVLILPTPA